MPGPDPSRYGIFTAHWVFWGAFGLARLIHRIRDRGRGSAADTAPSSPEAASAPFSRALLAFHGLAFAVMYLGLCVAVIPGRVPEWFRGQRVVGSLVIAGGAALVVSTLVYFRSWRFRAAVDTGHQLATGGPFRIVRHPIYLGLDLLALGSALWVPTAIVWAGFLLMAIGGDLRARSEETLLLQAFGQSYRDYCARTKRFVPGIY